MPGFPPKPISARSSSRKASTRATLYEIPPDAVEIPPLPDRLTDEGDPLPWRLETLAWWDDIWSSPMSAEYHPSDVHGLYRLAVLIDRFWDEPSEKISAEIRLVQRDYGLTPLDRRRLEWTIETAEAAKDRGERRTAAAQQQPMPGDGDAPADPRLSIA